jgi:hypothetical protein
LPLTLALPPIQALSRTLVSQLIQALLPI